MIARRLRRRKHPDRAGIVACLEELSVEQSQDSVRALEAELVDIEDSAGVPVESARLRCLLCRAGFGDPDAAAVAGEMALPAGVWQGGSIRKLEQLVEGLIDAREHQRRRH